MDGQLVPPLFGLQTAYGLVYIPRSFNVLRKLRRLKFVELTGVEPVSKQGILVLSTRLSWP